MISLMIFGDFLMIFPIVLGYFGDVLGMLEDDFRVNYANDTDQTNSMVDCPYFKTNFLALTQPMKQDLSQRDSFTIYMCVGGEATITNDWGSTSIQKGETALVAASSTHLEIDTQHAKLLEVTI